jgi:hypothetical protein
MTNIGVDGGSGVIHARIFIARPFDESAQKFFDRIIAPCLANLSLEPVHGPSCHNDNVVERVTVTIADCQAVLAILVGRNRNVFIETGIAIALNKPLLMLVETPQDCGMLQDRFPSVLRGDLAALRRALMEIAKRITPLKPSSLAASSHYAQAEASLLL